MSTTIVILNAALATLVLSVVVGMLLRAIQTSPREAQTLRVARERPATSAPRARITARPAYES